MDMIKVEKKWQAIWEKEKIASFNPKNIDKKYYCLEMFSYPSAAKLHLGHWYNYGPTDSFVRYKKMKGFETFQPMGFDAFGLPAENYAIKTGIHPKDSTEKNIANMEQTLKEMGALFDWNAEIKTCEEDYYKWTQWLFLKLYEKCYELLATEFPEITYWEPGNEFDMVDGTFLHPIGWTAGSSNVFTSSEAARITADLCWYANRGLQKVDKKNVTVFPGMTMSPTTATYLEETYQWIESKKIPTGEEYSDTNTWNYFQICAWHPYPSSTVEAAADTCETLYNVMKDHGDGDKKVWITETGFSEDRFGYDQDRIDALYKDLLDITKSRLKFVETLFLFRMTDCYTTPISDYEDHFGLFYAPGDPINKGKPKPYTETIYKWFNGENADTSGLYWYSTPQEE